MSKNLGKLHKATNAIHAGNEPEKVTGAIIPPIFQTSTFVQTSPGKHQGYEYTRSHNPTRTALEECLASLENAKYSMVTSSGMSAIMLILHTLKKDAKILCGDDVYGGTYRLLTKVFNKYHQTTFIDFTQTKDLEKAFKVNKPDLVWIETPTNPLLKLTDIKKLSKLCKKNKVILVVDNTFMSSFFQNPLDLGADIVIHSMTKYLNGHSDVVGGCLMLNDKKIYDQLWFLQNSIGPSQSPFDSWLVLRGLKTLAIRMERHAENASKIAKFLEKHPQVEKVIYPGLKSHPQHKLAKSQMHGFGGMITFFVKGDLAKSRKFLKKLKLFKLAESLGGVESLVDHPAIMTHASIPVKEREKLGITNNLIRLSVGIEDLDDLLNDLKNALV
ncbi:PLP-dependent aspartate aminotransferase family protein [Bacteriovoracaceae bacterium]|nr:PLP-dependent aspartate aminotransferase family protein [Bacteriovoracaceae bacterium]